MSRSNEPNIPRNISIHSLTPDPSHSVLDSEDSLLGDNLRYFGARTMRLQGGRSATSRMNWKHVISIRYSTRTLINQQLVSSRRKQDHSYLRHSGHDCSLISVKTICSKSLQRVVNIFFYVVQLLFPVRSSLSNGTF